MESVEEIKKLEEYKGLLISKDNEISKLNDLNISKENQIKELNNLIEEIKKGNAIGELEENFKKEKEQLLSKINNLELEIYNLKEKNQELIKKEKEIKEEKENEKEEKEEKEEVKNEEKEEDKKEEQEEDKNIEKEEEKKEEKKEEKEEEKVEEKKEEKEVEKKEEKEEGNKVEKEEDKKVEQDAEKEEEKKEEEKVIEKEENIDKENEKEEEQLNIEEDVDNKEEIDMEENNENKEKNNKLSYEELLKIKQDIEQKNKELVVEIKLLKDNSSEINNEDNIKKIEELQKKLLQYETGKIISDSTQKKLEETESQILELINKNKILTEKANSNAINRKEFETIIFKQENKISELNDLMIKKDLELFNKEHEANKNQIYSVQLLNIINDQKIRIEKIKKQSKEEANSKISELQREINNLENIVELKETMITNMKNTYKNLQDKYIKMTFNIKRKEQDFFLRQAKMLKNQKKERNNSNSLLYPTKNYSNIFNKKIKIKINDEPNSLSEIRYPNMRISSNSVINKKNKNKLLEKAFKNSRDIILPSINMNNSENTDIDKDLMVSGEKSKLEEINEMMKKVIDDENNNINDD